MTSNRVEDLAGYRWQNLLIGLTSISSFFFFTLFIANHGLIGNSVSALLFRVGTILKQQKL